MSPENPKTLGYAPHPVDGADLPHGPSGDAGHAAPGASARILAPNGHSRVYIATVRPDGTVVIADGFSQMRAQRDQARLQAEVAGLALDTLARRVTDSESTTSGNVPSGWVTVEVAASILDTTPHALRQRLWRASPRRQSDGTTTVTIGEGLAAKKVGPRSWRIHFTPSWRSR